jgi:hypothetical protein
MEERRHSDELEVQEDLDFERRSWIIERIGWGIMAMIGLAALAGLLGPGPLSRTTAGERGGQLWLEYSRFGRFMAPSIMRVHLGPNAGQQGSVCLWLSRDYLEGVEIQAISPPPERVEAGPGQLTYVLPVSGASDSTAVTFSLKTQQFGRRRGCVGLVNGPTLCFRQIIYP